MGEEDDGDCEGGEEHRLNKEVRNLRFLIYFYSR